ncbi:MAG: hypothetical protein AB2L24_19295 [Mangrovibacterium sp.]
MKEGYRGLSGKMMISRLSIRLSREVKTKDANIQPSDTPYYKDKGEMITKGRYYDGKGDFLTFVTHREKINPVPDHGAYRISKPDGSTEWVFRDDQDLIFNQRQLVFEGTAGLIRQSSDKKTYEAALFQGKKIGIPGMVLELKEIPRYAGMSLKNTAGGFTGIIRLRNESAISFSPETSVNNMVFYLDGIETTLNKTGINTFTLVVPKGEHHWQWTDSGVIPAAPEIKRSIAGKDWCELEWSSVPGAVTYVIQKSTDKGNKWTDAGETKNTIDKLTGLDEGKKIHVRVLAKGKGGAGEPSGDYPVYPGSAKPHALEGLIVVKSGDSVSLSWGQILGADQYSLYQRAKGSPEFRKVYSGTGRTATIRLENISGIDEFAVTATNGNGESEKSIPADTDESRFINWYPVPDEIFRRDTESQENGYDEYNHWIEQEMPVLKYPFQME